jgi:DNA-binding transcriptional LysR family regulator
MSPNVSLRQLRAFVAVAEHESFTQGARALHLTQSALSVLIRELEREVGVVLLDRSTRKVSLTEAGRELLPSVRSILGDLSGALSGISELRDKRRGVLRVAASQLMACALLPRLIARWQAQYPEMEVRLLDTSPEFLLARLHSSEAELAIGPDSAADLLGEAPVTRLTLFRDRHWLVCPLNHPLAQRKRVNWEELNEWPFITPTLDFVKRLSTALRDSGLHSETVATLPGTITSPAYAVSYMTTAMGMVANGLGLTICPTYAQALVRAHGLAMVEVGEPAFFRDVCVYQLARRSLSPAAASFLESIQRWSNE